MTTTPQLAPAIGKQCAYLSYPTGYMISGKACHSRAKYNELDEKGKPQDWCHNHAPSLVKQRNAALQVKYDADNAARRAKYRREAALRAACKGLSTEALESGVVKDALDILLGLKNAEWGEKYEALRGRADAVLRRAGRLT